MCKDLCQIQPLKEDLKPLAFKISSQNEDDILDEFIRSSLVNDKTKKRLIKFKNKRIKK